MQKFIVIAANLHSQYSDVLAVHFSQGKYIKLWATWSHDQQLRLPCLRFDYWTMYGYKLRYSVHDKSNPIVVQIQSPVVKFSIECHITNVLYLDL